MINTLARHSIFSPGINESDGPNLSNFYRTYCNDTGIISLCKDGQNKHDIAYTKVWGMSDAEIERYARMRSFINRRSHGSLRPLAAE